MFAQRNSSVYAMVDNNCAFWGESKKNILRPNFSMILHDPECENNCCTKSLDQSVPLHPSYYELDKLLNNATCNSMETCVTAENQILYNTTCNINKGHEIKVGEDQMQHSIEIAYSEFYCVQETEKAQSSNFFKDASDVKHQKSKETVKRKRKRTIFTTEQIVAMEGVFKKRPYVTKDERLSLTQKLNLSEKAIKIWFQNRRRVTEKREKDQLDSSSIDSTGEETYNAHIARLDYIEAQIKQTTDEHGFVTLDNKAIAELVHIIDTILSKNIDSDNCLHEKNHDINPNENYLMYEPISPESLPDECRQYQEISKWTPSIPEESFQRLIDIHSLLFS